MIRSVDICRFHTLQDKQFTFTEDINLITGSGKADGASLLHIIANSVQAVHKQCAWVKDDKCIDCIRAFNSAYGCKIRSVLQKNPDLGDPAPDHRGVLYTAGLNDGRKIPFRKYTSRDSEGFAVKPYYNAGHQNALPHVPVIYLSASRLLPEGKELSAALIEKVTSCLPVGYKNDIVALYMSLHGMTIPKKGTKQDQIKAKRRFVFSKNDNLLLILIALYTLKYYSHITAPHERKSILLIDTIDAGLHPRLQLKLYGIIINNTRKSKNQVFMTTNSKTLVKHALKTNRNVIYLDGLLEEEKQSIIDYAKIRKEIEDYSNISMTISQDEKPQAGEQGSVCIPIFTEDEEAKFFLDIIRQYFCETDYDCFGKINDYFHIVPTATSAFSLQRLFEDKRLAKTLLKTICMLDGDQQCALHNNIMTLPGNCSPESLMIGYSDALWLCGHSLLFSRDILPQGYTIEAHFRDFAKDANAIDSTYQVRLDNAQPINGFRRAQNKKLFRRHKLFMGFLFRHWLENPANQELVEEFYRNLWTLFTKVAALHGLQSHAWKQ